jgi:hypothetical protein
MASRKLERDLKKRIDDLQVHCFRSLLLGPLQQTTRMSPASGTERKDTV